jgi:hypothetical protein
MEAIGAGRALRELTGRGSYIVTQIRLQKEIKERRYTYLRGSSQQPPSVTLVGRGLLSSGHDVSLDLGGQVTLPQATAAKR